MPNTVLEQYNRYRRNSLGLSYEFENAPKLPLLYKDGYNQTEDTHSVFLYPKYLQIRSIPKGQSDFRPSTESFINIFLIQKITNTNFQYFKLAFFDDPKNRNPHFKTQDILEATKSGNSKRPYFHSPSRDRDQLQIPRLYNPYSNSNRNDFITKRDPHYLYDQVKKTFTDIVILEEALMEKIDEQSAGELMTLIIDEGESIS